MLEVVSLSFHENTTWDAKEVHEDLLKGNSQVQDLLICPVGFLEGLHATPVVWGGAEELVGHADNGIERGS